MNSNAVISEKTIQTTNTFIRGGGFFTFATARSIYSAVPKTAGIGINVPCILMNGVSIYDIKNDCYVKNEFIPVEASAEVLRAFERHGVHCFMYRIEAGILTCYYSELTTNVMRSFAEVRKYEYKKPFVQCRLADHADENTVYFTTTGEYEKLLPVKLEAEKIPGVDLAFYLDIYNGAWYLEIFSHKASKANGIRFIREKYAFDKVVAFGDNLNDLPMFAEADIKVAVGNARDEVRAAADYIIGTNDEDGVAEWLMKTTTAETSADI